MDPVRAGEAAIASLLRWGVAVAALLLGGALLASWILGLPLGGSAVPVGRLFSGGADPLPMVAEVGLLILAATPLARVALSVRVFARAGERGQALVAVGVLALLVGALLLGATEA